MIRTGMLLTHPRSSRDPAWFIDVIRLMDVNAVIASILPIAAGALVVGFDRRSHRQAGRARTAAAAGATRGGVRANLSPFPPLRLLETSRGSRCRRLVS